MDLEKYKELTGIDVPTSKEATVKANIRRTKAMLENMLGYSLKPKNLYSEKGKVQFEGYLPIEDLTTILPPDEEEGVYKLFHYNENDRYFHVDPFKNVYKVKLVMPVNDNEFITVVDLDNVVALKERNGIGRFIERHYEWFTWAWYATWRLSWKEASSAGLQIAVEADWIDCYSDDIMYLWADMITYQSDPSAKIKSESVDGHSWSKADTKAPEEEPSNLKALSKYAGPYGSVARNPVP